MKKALVLMFSFLLCTAVVACGDDKGASKTEYYKLSAMIGDGESITGDMLAETSLSGWYIVLNPDGSGVFNGDRKTKMTWANNTISAEGESLKFAKEGNKLIIDMGDEGKIEFTLSSDTPPAD